MMVPDVAPDQYLWGGGPNGRPLKFVWLDAVTASGLKPMSTVGVLHGLAQRADGDGRVRVSIPQLVAVMRGSASQSTIERAIRQALNAGWLVQVRRGNSIAGATTYQLAIPSGFVWPVLETALPVRSEGLLPVRSEGLLPVRSEGLPPARDTAYPSEVTEATSEVTGYPSEVTVLPVRSDGPSNLSNLSNPVSNPSDEDDEDDLSVWDLAERDVKRKRAEEERRERERFEMQA